MTAPGTGMGAAPGAAHSTALGKINGPRDGVAGRGLLTASRGCRCVASRAVASLAAGSGSECVLAMLGRLKPLAAPAMGACLGGRKPPTRRGGASVRSGAIFVLCAADGGSSDCILSSAPPLCAMHLPHACGSSWKETVFTGRASECIRMPSVEAAGHALPLVAMSAARELKSTHSPQLGAVCGVPRPSFRAASGVRWTQFGPGCGVTWLLLETPTRVFPTAALCFEPGAAVAAASSEAGPRTPSMRSTEDAERRGGGTACV
jgi:hypothetical protein